MGHAIDDLSSRSSNQHNASKDSKSGILSSRSVKYLLLGGLAVSIGSMESGAGKAADVARFSDNLPTSDVGLIPKIPKSQDYVPLKTSCAEGIFAGLAGALIVQNPMPLMVLASLCLSGAVAQQRIGNEFQVNTYTDNHQDLFSISSFSNGNFVVIWASLEQDGSGYGVYGQLFYGNANRIGNEFQANTYTTDHQNYPSVASFSNGNFVVTWDSNGQDGLSSGIYGQLFYGNTSKLGNEFQINTYTLDRQSYPSVASFSNGNFVVTWESDGQDGSLDGVYGQLFDESASRIGNEFQVNTYTNNNQYYISVASFSSGNFVVTWHSNGQDGNGAGTYGQLFDNNANRIGNEFQVNSYTINDQSYPSVETLNNGNFVVTWHSDGQDGSNYGIYGQLFDESASRIGNEFQINTYTTDNQQNPRIASFSNSNFVVAWQSNGQDGDGYGAYGQLFYGNTTKLGNEFQVNSYTTQNQGYPSVASFSNGNFVVTWDSYFQAPYLVGARRCLQIT